MSQHVLHATFVLFPRKKEKESAFFFPPFSMSQHIDLGTCAQLGGARVTSHPGTSCQHFPKLAAPPCRFWLPAGLDICKPGCRRLLRVVHGMGRARTSVNRGPTGCFQPSPGLYALFTPVHSAPAAAIRPAGCCSLAACRFPCLTVCCASPLLIGACSAGQAWTAVYAGQVLQWQPPWRRCMAHAIFPPLSPLCLQQYTATFTLTVAVPLSFAAWALLHRSCLESSVCRPSSSVAT